ncbi:hypothetical protein THAOC_06018, partial [Thalassiosira oceanica]
MQALSQQRKGEDDVAERLRIEETKAQLARAKEGMAKEAERVAAEKEAKEAKKQGGGGPVAPSGGLGGGGAGGKWVPSHMRGAGGGSSIRGPASMPSVRGPASMDGSGFQRPVDTACEELFPDLADADKIMKEKEEREAKEVAANTVSSSQPLRAPAGWGSRMGQPGSSGGSSAPAQRRPLSLTKPAERKPLNLSAPTKEDPVAAKVESPPPSAADEKPKKVESEPEAGPEKSPEPAAPKPAATAAAPAAPKVEKKLKKKKKKDLSTFKAKS